jgi:hypothetical protein
VASQRPTSNRVRTEITGLQDFLRDLGYAEDHWDEAERAFLDITVRTMIERAKHTAQSQGRLEAKAAADMRQQGTGVIVYGGQGYSKGAEFGAYRYRQFETWRGNGDDAGYFLWPTVRQFRDEEFLNDYAETVLGILKRAFPDRS